MLCGETLSVCGVASALTTVAILIPLPRRAIDHQTRSLPRGPLRKSDVGLLRLGEAADSFAYCPPSYPTGYCLERGSVVRKLRVTFSGRSSRLIRALSVAALRPNADSRSQLSIFPLRNGPNERCNSFTSNLDALFAQHRQAKTIRLPRSPESY